MNNNKDFTNLGDHIRDSVQSAIDSMDFKQLNKTISDTVNFALDEAKSQVAKGAEGFRTKNTNTGSREQFSKEAAAEDKPARGPGYRAFQTSRRKENLGRFKGVSSQTKPAVRFHQTGRVAGILYTVFGSLGLGVSVIILLTVWLLALLIKPLLWTVAGASVFLLLIGGGFGLMLRSGVSMRRRLKRAGFYLNQAGERMYCNITELASGIGKSREFVIKDIKKLISLGILPDAHLDEQNTCLMLGEESYKQYLECQKALKDRIKQEALEKAQEDERESLKGSLEPVRGLEEMMAAGRNYMRILREANEAIPGEVISEKILKLETVIRRIFESVERHPEQMEEMERFMNYYLPTTVKLVNAYRDFDRVGSDGTNIGSAKEEIEKTLDTINTAFERLLDDLYQDAVLDITTDASVLQTMLKQDGFAESDFTGGKNHE